MSLTEEQFRLASRIDKYVNDILSNGGDDVDILRGLPAYVDTFTQLMDTSSKSEMDRLCRQYDGFRLFVGLLDALAGAIADGKIQLSRK